MNQNTAGFRYASNSPAVSIYEYVGYILFAHFTVLAYDVNHDML